jgi:hypothetical protein
MMMHHAHNHDGDLGLHYNDGKLIITSKMVPGISQLDLQKINCICSTNPMASIIFCKDAVPKASASYSHSTKLRD